MIPFHLELPLIVLAAIILAYAVKFILKRTAGQPRSREWVSTFLQSFTAISTPLIVGYGVLYALQLAAQRYQFPITHEQIAQIKDLFLVFIAAWFSFSWKNRHEALLLQNIKEGKGAPRDPSLITGVGKLLTLLIIAAAALLALGILKINYTALLAFGGLGGLAISWAAKDVIANFFGGLMIHINRPFSIGDWIKSTNKNFEGIVEQIGWYMTRIRNLDRRPTYIPNALITDAIIENPGRMHHRRILITVGLRYQDYPLVQPIIDDIKEMLQQHPDISKSLAPMVHLVAFNQSSIDIEVFCFTRKTKTQEFRDLQQEILFKIGDIVNNRGAELAFPTQTIQLINSLKI